MDKDRKDFEKRTITIRPTTQREEYNNQLLDALVSTNHVFAKGDRVVTDLSGELEQLDKASVVAKLLGHIVNIVKIDQNGKSKAIDPPVADAEFVMQSQICRQFLPQIEYVTEVPALGDEFEIVRPGYNPGTNIYYDGDAIQPEPNREHLNKLLDVFCFKRPVDRINFIGFLLTPFLGKRFAGGRPICTLRGNQQGIGKTAAGQILAVIHSANAQMLSVTYKRHDEELEKCISGVVKKTNCILVDNVNDPSGRVICSPSIERTITLPTYNFRRVGTSETITGPNYLQFVITFNGGKMSVDLSTRSVFILMEFEGDPSKRKLPEIGDPVDYAHEHRDKLVAELLGMVQVWQEKGRLLVPVPSRFRGWSSMVNGILTANGYDGFLSTHLQDAREDDELQIALIELANSVPGSYRRPADWLAECLRLNLFQDHLHGRTERGQQTYVGNMLRAAYGREVLVDDLECCDVKVFRVDRKEDRNGMTYAFTAVKGEKDRELNNHAADKAQDHPSESGNGRVRRTIVAT